jgi:hypothetical protein
VNLIVHDVVVEAGTGSHPFHDFGQFKLGIRCHIGRSEAPVVPVVSHDKVRDPERVNRKRREHQSGTARVLDIERISISPTPQLIGLAGAHEVVIIGIDWEEDPNPALGIGMKHQQVPISVGSDLDARVIAAHVVSVLIQ